MRRIQGSVSEQKAEFPKRKEEGLLQGKRKSFFCLVLEIKFSFSCTLDKLYH
jgi:hypothetical protein